MRLKPQDIKPLRLELLKQQNYTCAICQEPLTEQQAVLDHCHQTGRIRSVLHRGCNCYIGHLENNQKRNQITASRLTSILANYATYVQTQKDILHPAYRTPEERQERARKRAKKRRQKR